MRRIARRLDRDPAEIEPGRQLARGLQPADRRADEVEQLARTGSCAVPAELEQAVVLVERVAVGHAGDIVPYGCGGGRRAAAAPARSRQPSGRQSGAASSASASSRTTRRALSVMRLTL